jgi:hypothetical protein
MGEAFEKGQSTERAVEPMMMMITVSDRRNFTLMMHGKNTLNNTFEEIWKKRVLI